MTKPKTSNARKTKPKDAPPPMLPARGAMESVLAMLGGGRQEEPIDRAQDLMYQAWEAPTRARRLALARQALAISPDCADAYMLLAEESTTNDAEMIELLRNAVAAGERSLGKRAFTDDVGHFWGLLETRPYMRARAGLAQCLWETGQRDEAIAHYRDLLRLNPNDNQGLRYVLATCLLDLGRDDDLASLLRTYKDDATATWTYSAALVAFRTHGSGAKSQRLLDAAMATNPHVPAYLLGKKKLPRRLPDYVGFGDESEAVVYVSSAAGAWKKTPGALDWLRVR